MKRAESQARTRKALAQAAAEVFGERGLHGASLDDVASRAGFTKGAVYSNFDSKEELFLEGFRSTFDHRRPTADELNRLILAGDLEGASRAYDAIWADIDMAQWLLGTEFLLWAQRDRHIQAMAAESLNRSIEDAVDDLTAVSGGAGRADVRFVVIALAALELGLGLLDDIVDGLDRPGTYLLTASALLGGAG